MILGLEPENTNTKSEETSQKSSNYKVSGFVIPSKNEVFSEKCPNEYLSIEEPLYSVY